MSDPSRHRASRLAPGASRRGLAATRKTLPRGTARRNCSKRSSSPATAWRSRATIRSRPISSPRPGECRSRAVHDLHMVQSVLALPDHLAVFERGIANRLDFAFAGPQSRKLADSSHRHALKIGAIHTYLELYARMLVDLTPHVALVVADKADRDGNLYTGPNTEDTPTIVEAAAFRGGIVVAQVNEIVDRCRGSTSRPTGSISSCRARKPLPRSIRCSPAIPPRSRTRTC